MSQNTPKRKNNIIKKGPGRRRLNRNQAVKTGWSLATDVKDAKGEEILRRGKTHGLVNGLDSPRPSFSSRPSRDLLRSDRLVPAWTVPIQKCEVVPQ